MKRRKKIVLDIVQGAVDPAPKNAELITDPGPNSVQITMHLRPDHSERLVKLRDTIKVNTGQFLRIHEIVDGIIGGVFGLKIDLESCRSDFDIEQAIVNGKRKSINVLPSPPMKRLK